VLRFLAQLEVERTTHASCFVPTYLLQHPSATTRMAVVKNAAKSRRAD
jgi:hypothetical protein